MIIYIGADHRGYELKEKIISRLKEHGVQVSDVGNSHFDPEDDYSDFAYQVGLSVSRDNESKGVVICGSGVGVDVTANKVKGVRSGLVYDLERVKQARNDDDINVLALAADVLDENTAWEMVRMFVNTPFSGEQRHIRRIQKLQTIERGDA